MKRLAHGAILEDGAQPLVALPDAISTDEKTVDCPRSLRFDYLFPELQNDPSKLLPDMPTTAQALIDLGNSMTDSEPADSKPDDRDLDSTIPSVYSYFGQFITHEVVFESTTQKTKLGPETVPLEFSAIPQLINARSAQLDLDSVYGPILDKEKCYAVPRNGDELEVSRAGFSQVDGTDLPRQQKPPFTARIGDRRNDANLIISQMHLAFLRAHNALVKKNSYDDARRLLRQHFQYLVVHDFLEKITDKEVFTSIKDGIVKIFDPPRAQVFMPVEFSAAAFRFGHSMLRNRYHYNDSYKNVRLRNLFLPKSGGYHHIPHEWIIDWKGFLPGGVNLARKIDTHLAQPLIHLIDENGERVETSLAALDLLRGYLLRLPTGQAVAAHCHLPIMTPTQIENVAANEKQKEILAKGLSSQTPLWFYILAEAAHFNQGLCLGKVGSTIVAGVLYELVRRSNDSILLDPKWVPTLGSGRNFELEDLFRLAEVV